MVLGLLFCVGVGGGGRGLDILGKETGSSGGENGAVISVFMSWHAGVDKSGSVDGGRGAWSTFR